VPGPKEFNSLAVRAQVRKAHDALEATAGVVRQNRFRPFSSVSSLVSALETECALKQGTKRAIGFY
jgi:hypothetical protein